VNDVDEEVLRSLAGIDKMRSVLPIVLVDTSLTDTREVAILSWRWDILHNGVSQPSRNIQAAVHIAKQLGFRCLLIDCLAIDQTWKEDQLIGQVTSFSALYRKLPVIAAYDMNGEDYPNTMRRPWILSEIRNMAMIPNQVVYAGHIRGGGCLERIIFGGHAKRRYRWPLAEEFIELAWKSSFISTALRLLFGVIDMQCISDFKFLMPLYARVLNKAYERMGQNDYLLTVALLCLSNTRYSNSEEDWDITTLSFNQYSLRKYTGEGKWSSSWIVSDLYPGNTKAGCWRSRCSRFLGVYQTHFEPAQSTERAIFTTLGLMGVEWKEFVANEADRHAFLFPPHKIECKNLKIQHFVVGTWKRYKSEYIK
jgi:hypothetical protein